MQTTNRKPYRCPKNSRWPPKGQRAPQVVAYVLVAGGETTCAREKEVVLEKTIQQPASGN